MNKYIPFIVLGLILLFVLLHIYNYTSLSYDEYQILQQDIDKVDGSKLYKEPFPFVMTYIENDTLHFNIQRYLIYSPISVQHTYDNKILGDFEKNKYMTHYYPYLMMKVDKDIDLTIIPSKYGNNVKDGELVDLSNTQQVLIKLHPYNIVYIPRFSYWKLDGDNETKVEIYYSHMPISVILSKIYKFMNKNNNKYVY
jgi:hypothetical protein